MRFIQRKYFNIMVGIFFFTAGCFVTINFLQLDCVCSLSEENSLKTYKNIHMNIEYVVLILSSPKNAITRQAIRESWAMLASNIILENSEKLYRWNISLHEPAVVPYIKHFFIIGTYNLDHEIETKLQEESNKNNDILLLETHHDNYKNLAAKMLQSLTWMNENLPMLKYVIKCDDDSFVRIDLIVNNLEAFAPAMNAPQIEEFVTYQTPSQQGSNGLYWGYFNGRGRVFSQGKWQEKDWFMCDHYLPYALGGGYVISKKVVEYVARNVDFLSLYSSEDVSMGVWTAALVGINRVHDIRFDTEWKSRGCSNDMLIRHKQTSDQMMDLYRNLLYSKGEKLCKTENALKIPYQYKWGVAPSKCCNSW